MPLTCSLLPSKCAFLMWLHRSVRSALELVAVGGLWSERGAHALTMLLPESVCWSINQSSTRVLEGTVLLQWHGERGYNQETHRILPNQYPCPALVHRTTLLATSPSSLFLFQPRLSSNITATWTDSRRLRDGLVVQIKPDRPS